MDPFMEILESAVPDNSEEKIGDVEGITKEVDEDGNPLGDDAQEEARKLDPIAPRPQDATGKAKMDVTQVTSGKINGFQDNIPYCPVYCEQCDNGGRYFTAYISGSIQDVDQYVDLIDTLLIATEKDCYDIFIDSPGGMIASGGFIASAIHHSKATVRTISRGICASAGALIHSAAKPENAIVSPTSIHMYHMSSHADFGYSTLIKARAEQQVRYVNECLLNKAVEIGHITKEEFDMIQAGDEIYVSGMRFQKHQEDALNQAESEPAEPEAGQESFRAVVGQLKTYPFFMSREDQENLSAEMCPPGVIQPPKQEPLLIRTADQKNFRIYMRANSYFMPNYVAKICRFLDSRRPGETVTFILGTKLDDQAAFFIGPIAMAMQNCAAEVITIAAGYCSIPETFLWIHGKQRVMYRYGALSFNTTDVTKVCPEMKHYFSYMLAKGQEIGLLTEEDVTTIWRTKLDKLILYSDIVKE